MLGFTIHSELNRHTLECNTYFQVNYVKLTHADIFLHLRQIFTEKALKVNNLSANWNAKGGVGGVCILAIRYPVHALPQPSCTAPVSVQCTARAITAFPLHNASETWS